MTAATMRPKRAHVLLDRALADSNADPQQLAADALGAPEPVLVAISPIKVMVSTASVRFAFPARDRARREARNPSRCHRRRIFGWTMARARRQPGSTFALRSRRRRSNRVSFRCAHFLRRR